MRRSTKQFIHLHDAFCVMQGAWCTKSHARGREVNNWPLVAACKFCRSLNGSLAPWLRALLSCSLLININLILLTPHPGPQLFCTLIDCVSWANSFATECLSSLMDTLTQQPTYCRGVQAAPILCKHHGRQELDWNPLMTSPVEQRIRSCSP